MLTINAAAYTKWEEVSLKRQRITEISQQKLNRNAFHFMYRLYLMALMCFVFLWDLRTCLSSTDRFK